MVHASSLLVIGQLVTYTVNGSMQDGEEEEGKEEFAIVFAAMGVNMETAHYFKQVCHSVGLLNSQLVCSALYTVCTIQIMADSYMGLSVQHKTVAGLCCLARLQDVQGVQDAA